MKSSLDDPQWHWFRGSGDHAESGAYGSLELLQVRELTLEEVEKDTAEPLWKLLWVAKELRIGLDLVAEALDVEEYAFATIEDPLYNLIGVRAPAKLRIEPVA